MSIFSFKPTASQIPIVPVLVIIYSSQKEGVRGLSILQHFQKQRLAALIKQLYIRTRQTYVKMCAD